MIAVLTEKPSVARDMATALGCHWNVEGKYYESTTHIITNAIGHLLETAPPEKHNPEWKKWRLATLPIMPSKMIYNPISKTSKQLTTVKKTLKKPGITELIIATDAGREGELIARLIIDHIGLNIPARRFWVSSALTPETVQNGIKVAKPWNEYNTLAEEARARQTADWLLGINFSRLVTLAIGSPDTLSYGRVQSALLKCINGREQAHDDHKPEMYSTVDVTLQNKDGQKIVGKLINQEDKPNTKFLQKHEGLLNTQIGNIGETATMGNVQEKTKTTPPPLLHNLGSLQRAMAKKGLAIAKTAEYTQELYETHKCLSYPRTPSRVMGDSDVELVRSIAKRYNLEVNPHDKRLFNDEQLEDHHALVPLAPLPSNVTNTDMIAVYQEVERFFKGILSGNRVVNQITATAQTNDNTIIIKAQKTQQAGWTAIIQQKKEEPQETPITFQNGQAFTVLEHKNKKEKTKPPALYNEGTLLQLMENPGKNLENDEFTFQKGQGIGTPATRTDIINRLASRKLIGGTKKAIRIAPAGETLIKTLKLIPLLDEITNVDETAKWETLLKKNPDVFLGEIKTHVKEIVKMGQETSFEKQNVVGKCPKCGDNVEEKEKAFGCAGYHTEKKCDFVIWKTTFGMTIDKKTATALLQDGKTEILDGKSHKTGKSFKAALVWKDGKVQPEFEQTEDKGVAEETEFTCPKCQGKIVELPRSYQCADKECKFFVYKTFRGKEIDKGILKELIENGTTKEMEFTARNGKPYTGILVLNTEAEIPLSFEFSLATSSQEA